MVLGVSVDLARDIIAQAVGYVTGVSRTNGGNRVACTQVRQVRQKRLQSATHN